MKKYRLSVGLLLLAVTCFGEVPSKLSLGIEGGVSAPLSPGDVTDEFKMDGAYGARLRFDASDRFSFGARYTHLNLKDKTAAGRKFTLQPFVAEAHVWLFSSDFWSPYLAVGAGISQNKQDHAATSESNTGFVGTIGLGADFRINDFTSFSIDSTYRHFSKATFDERGVGAAGLAVLLNFYLPDTWMPVKPDKAVDLTEYPEEAATAAAVTNDDTEKKHAQEALDKLENDIAAGKVRAVAFDPGSATVTRGSNEALDIVGNILRRSPSVKLRVRAFGDPDGDARDSLAKDRGQYIVSYWVRNFAVSAERLSVGLPAPVEAPEKSPTPKEPSAPDSASVETAPSMPGNPPPAAFAETANPTSAEPAPTATGPRVVFEISN